MGGGRADGVGLRGRLLGVGGGGTVVVVETAERGMEVVGRMVVGLVVVDFGMVRVDEVQVVVLGPVRSSILSHCPKVICPDCDA